MQHHPPPLQSHASILDQQYLVKYNFSKELCKNIPIIQIEKSNFNYLHVLKHFVNGINIQL